MSATTSVLDDDDELRPRKGKSAPLARRRIIGNKQTVARTVRRTPEVLVKISSSARDMRAVNAAVDYLSRKGMVELEDEQGNVFLGDQARQDALYTWQGIPASNGTRRETFHVIFSMPAGTDRVAVTESVSRLAKKEYRNHQYVFATHNDTDKPHVHVVVNATPYRGTKRLNPRKADLQRWREGFAENLRSLGVEANATPRVARGVVKRFESQAVRHMAQRGVALTRAPKNPSPETETRYQKVQIKVLNEYGAMAKELINGNAADRALAVDITHFVQSTGMDLPMREASMQKSASNEPEPGPSR